MKQTVFALLLALLLTTTGQAAEDNMDAAAAVSAVQEAPVNAGADSVADEVRAEIHDAITEIKNEIEGLSDQDKAELERMLNRGVPVDFGHGPEVAFGVLVPILAISLSLGGPIIIVAIVLYASYRKRKQRLELIAKFVDSNREIPQEILNSLDAASAVRNDLRSGLLAMGSGIGVLVALGLLAGWEVGALGLIPFFIGLARLLVWKLERNTDAKLP